MLNLGDGSLYVTPSLDWNAAENLYIGAGALLPSGRRARYNGLSASPDSEFGLYDRSLYAAARFYF